MKTAEQQVICVSKYPKVGCPAVHVQLELHLYFVMYQGVDTHCISSRAECTKAASAQRSQHLKAAWHKHSNTSSLQLVHVILIPYNIVSSLKAQFQWVLCTAEQSENKGGDLVTDLAQGNNRTSLTVTVPTELRASTARAMVVISLALQ